MGDTGRREGRARDHHYVPAAMLRRWALDGTHVWAYRTLVSNAKVPQWKRNAVRGIAYHRDLYTVFAGGREVDDVEKWLAAEVDGPALDAIQRAVAGGRLTPQDWRHMVRFLIVQEQRTLVGFMKAMLLARDAGQHVLQRTVDEILEELKKLDATGIEPTYPPSRPNAFSGLLSVRIEQEPIADEEGTAMRKVTARITPGRQLWIAVIRNAIDFVENNRECRHRWSLATPYGDEEWPLTDNPSLRVFWRPDEKGYVEGGWGLAGSEIMMPISPRHLLFVRVGSKLPNRFTFAKGDTQRIQRLLVQYAHRWIFGTQPAEWIPTVRPRVVNPDALRVERSHWDRFHEEQLASEIRDAEQQQN